MTLLFQWLVLVVSLGLASYLLEGIRIDGLWPLPVAAAILGIINRLLKPLVLLVTLPINILTIGLFTLVINAAMLFLASLLVPGFDVEGFGAAFFGALIVGITNWMVNIFLGKIKIVRHKSRFNGDTIDLKKRKGDKWE